MGNALRQVRAWVGAGVTLGAAGALGAGTAAPPADLSGVYENQQGTLAVIQGGNETLVYYLTTFPQGQSVGTCECALGVKDAKAARWVLGGGDLGNGQLSLTPAPQRLVLEGRVTNCCGAGWPGRDEFPRSAAPGALRACRVLGARVHFQDASEAHAPRPAYVVKGDTVEAFVPDTEPDLVPARFKGARTATAGWLGRAELACAEPGTAPGVKAETLQPLAGRWVELTKRGKDYVRVKPCGADPGAFVLQADAARLEVDWGQESASVQVTALQPGRAKGAYVLDVTREDGTREQVAWTVADAGKGIVSLTSPVLFAQHHTYVRDTRKGAFREAVEPNCPQEEGE